MQRLGAVEDVIGRNVHQWQAMLPRRLNQSANATDIDRPRLPPALRSLSCIDLGVASCVDHDAVWGEVKTLDRLRTRKIQRVTGHRDRCRNYFAQRPTKLTTRADDQDLLRFHRRHVGESRMRLVGSGKLGLLKWDWPVDGQCLVGKVHEDIGLPGCGLPMIIDQIGIRRLLGQGLISISHATWDKDRSLWAYLHGETATKAMASTQVDPCAEDAPRCQRYQLVPRLGVNASRCAGSVVEGDVVLHRRKVWQAKLDHLLPLPVLLEPAAIVSSDIQGDQQ